MQPTKNKLNLDTKQKIRQTPLMNHQQAEALRSNANYWYLGVIYFCREDPRPIVRNRIGLGWTWNFGSPLALPLLVVAVLLFLLPLLLFAPGFIQAGQNFISATELIAIYGVLMTILIAVSHYIASGPR